MHPGPLVSTRASWLWVCQAPRTMEWLGLHEPPPLQACRSGAALPHRHKGPLVACGNMMLGSWLARHFPNWAETQLGGRISQAGPAGAEGGQSARPACRKLFAVLQQWD